MANKLKPYIPMILGKAKPPKETTDLGDALREEAAKLPDYEHELRRRAEIAANTLDRTVKATGRSPEDARNLQAYHAAARCYAEITGSDYVE